MKSTSLSPQKIKLLEDAAIRGARAAGSVLLKYFTKPLRVQEKKDAGLVTQVDIEAEGKAMGVLKRAFPHFSFLAEESGSSGARSSGSTEGRWVIDPLDGTTNYIHRFPMFCVSIAAEWQGELVAGVVYHPILKDMYVAGLGRGARLNGKKISVSKTQRLEDSLLTTGFTYRKDQLLHSEMEAFERLSGIARAIRRPGSAALDLAYTARGVFDGFWERRLSPWDVAAGILLVREAGGTVTDFGGTPSRIEHPELLASNTSLHPDILIKLVN